MRLLNWLLICRQRDANAESAISHGDVVVSEQTDMLLVMYTKTEVIFYAMNVGCSLRPQYVLRILKI